jgi:hypothetical protein
VLTGRHDPIPRHKARKARIANRTARGSGGSAPARRCEARRAGTCHLHRLSNAANDQLTNAGPCHLVRIRADPKTGDARE